LLFFLDIKFQISHGVKHISFSLLISNNSICGCVAKRLAKMSQRQLVCSWESG